MNLIIFVLSLILVLSAMSYARLDSFLKSRFHAKEWSWIMQESERDLYNRKQKSCNKKTEKETKKEESPTSKDSPGNGRISLSWFFKKEFREKNPALFLETKELSQELVKNAWGNQPFYKDLEKEKPDFVSLMFEEIIQLADRASEKDSKAKLTHLEDLIYLPWSDLQIKTAFGRMLQEGLIYNKKGREL
ncbi:MAG: hypothetical protein KDK62_06545, partial [Chlamydiia bacterium]|nr:hypothetical protein [Chlamydiia bacterium]